MQGYGDDSGAGNLLNNMKPLPVGIGLAGRGKPPRERVVMKKKSKKNLYYDPKHSLGPGEPFWVKEDFYLGCCDCGLRHHVVVKRKVRGKGRLDKCEVTQNKEWICLEFYRDDKTTNFVRKERGIKVLKKSNK
ncbi:hypothetical protein [Candidatus Magnetobacterium casense]|uniref:Uncharacterized protein n=1 Tax=Candidatus Magnetobacterium casense TaxID=1455061 RepID=A0ABS6RXB6_9BACT|nr:hypothetical protein [Candidatus Magnetobacterium casensis]MBV6341077.1 hypothetical protein [Candidatus Magnetobacterium casensis]